MSGRHEHCGTRLHHRPTEPDPCPIAHGQAVGLTPLGLALLDALREDPAYAELIDDPFGERAGGPA